METPLEKGISMSAKANNPSHVANRQESASRERRVYLSHVHSIEGKRKFVIFSFPESAPCAVDQRILIIRPL